MMIKQEKNSIFEMLRDYHESVFPVPNSSIDIAKLKIELEDIQEKTMSMVLGFVYGRSEFVDWSDEINTFANKAKAQKVHNQLEESDKALIGIKTNKLLKVIELTRTVNLKSI